MRNTIRLMVGLLLLKIGEHIGQIVFLLGLIILTVSTVSFLLIGISKIAVMWATVGVAIACVGARLMD